MCDLKRVFRVRIIKRIKYPSNGKKASGPTDSFNKNNDITVIL